MVLRLKCERSQLSNRTLSCCLCILPGVSQLLLDSGNAFVSLMKIISDTRVYDHQNVIQHLMTRLLRCLGDIANMMKVPGLTFLEPFKNILSINSDLQAIHRGLFCCRGAKKINYSVLNEDNMLVVIDLRAHLSLQYFHRIDRLS